MSPEPKHKHLDLSRFVLNPYIHHQSKSKKNAKKTLAFLQTMVC